MRFPTLPVPLIALATFACGGDPEPPGTLEEREPAGSEILPPHTTASQPAAAPDPPEPRFHPDALPDRLSEWGMMAANGHTLTLAPTAVPYELNTALFSDYAHKLRTVWLPPGARAVAEGDEVLDFPVGSVLTKTFYYPRAPGDPEVVGLSLEELPGWFAGSLDLRAVRLIETRILARRDEGWIALPYVWNEAQTEARLRRTGEIRRLRLEDAEGNARRLAYLVPNTNQCGACHVTDAATRAVEPIGPRPRHLNRDFPYPEGRENQLARLIRVGYLTGLDGPEAASRAAHWTGQESLTTVDLEATVRSYLDINCAHCHSPGGPGRTSGLRLMPETPLGLAYGLCKPPVAAGAGTGGWRFSIVPGDPDASILLHRMEIDDPAVMMPELGRSTVHREAVALVRRWIGELEGDCS